MKKEKKGGLTRLLEDPLQHNMLAFGRI